jgi:hypothetical protein
VAPLNKEQVGLLVRWAEKRWSFDRAAVLAQLAAEWEAQKEELRLSYPKTPVDCILSEIHAWLSEQGYNDWELGELFARWKSDSGLAASSSLTPTCLCGKPKGHREVENLASGRETTP